MGRRQAEQGEPMHAEEAKAGQVAQLVRRARAGDHAAFDALVEEYSSQVYNLALRITGSREEAEDCVQEAFLRAYAALPRFRGRAAFSTWLYRVALNVACDAARRRRRAPLAVSELATGEDPAPDLDRPLGEGLPPRRESPEEGAILHQRRRVILEAIQRLPEHQRAVLVLYDLQGFSYEEIARITGARVGTVKSRLSRARLALRDLLTPHLELLRE